MLQLIGITAPNMRKNLESPEQSVPPRHSRPFRAFNFVGRNQQPKCNKDVRNLLKGSAQVALLSFRKRILQHIGCDFHTDFHSWEYPFWTLSAGSRKALIQRRTAPGMVENRQNQHL
jgi:hypothetical protein